MENYVSPILWMLWNLKLSLKYLKILNVDITNQIRDIYLKECSSINCNLFNKFVGGKMLILSHMITVLHLKILVQT